MTGHPRPEYNTISPTRRRLPQQRRIEDRSHGRMIPFALFPHSLMRHKPAMPARQRAARSKIPGCPFPLWVTRRPGRF